VTREITPPIACPGSNNISPKYMSQNAYDLRLSIIKETIK
jgi:hypothetical protein